eukprot:TRINITY_DN4226_c0_g1_i1.p2 TRINITY_DN4226_c0_g1~~TRINITY_DN4226_c0_g1_i1.p2  ORF type:complete len:163 (+),score=20.19 TRINITY_DN4226_c0_g1_i1:212-700(+)
MSLKNSSEVRRALWPRSVGLLKTDASQYGWGGMWNELVTARGFFSANDRLSHISVKEIAAVRFFLLALPEHFPIADGELHLRIDRRVAMACINYFSSRSPALTAELHLLYQLCRDLRLSIRLLRSPRSPTFGPTASAATETVPTGGSTRRSSFACPPVTQRH